MSKPQGTIELMRYAPYGLPKLHGEIIADMMEKDLLVGYYILRPSLKNSEEKHRRPSLVILETHCWPEGAVRQPRGFNEVAPHLEELVESDEENVKGPLYVIAMEDGKASNKALPRVLELESMFHEMIADTLIPDQIYLKPLIICRTASFERRQTCKDEGVRVLQVAQK